MPTKGQRFFLVPLQHAFITQKSWSSSVFVQIRVSLVYALRTSEEVINACANAYIHSFCRYECFRLVKIYVYIDKIPPDRNRKFMVSSGPVMVPFLNLELKLTFVIKYLTAVFTSHISVFNVCHKELIKTLSLLRHLDKGLC